MYIFAADPNSLAQQRNYYDATNVNLAEKDRALRQAALDEERRTYLFQQERDEQRAQQAQADALRYSLGQQELGRRDRDEARRQYEFGVGQQNQAAQNREQTRQFDVGSGLKEKEIAAVGAQRKEAQGAKDFSELATAINNEEITEDNQIDTLFKNLDPSERDRGKAYLAAHQKGLTKDWEEINKMAGAATALVSPTPVAPKPVSHLFGLYHTQPPTPERVKLTEDEAMAKLLGTNNKNLLQYQPMLQWDEELQKFQPVTPKPSFHFGATNAPAPLPAPAPAAPAVPPAGALNAANLMPLSVAPPTPPRPLPLLAANTPATPGINWAPAPTNTPPVIPMAPVVATAKTNPASLYKVGGIYRGGLQYLGGDISDPRSWKKVQ